MALSTSGDVLIVHVAVDNLISHDTSIFRRPRYLDASLE